MLQRVDLALAQERAELQRKAGARHHLLDRHGQRHRQPHAALSGRRRHADPAALRDRPVAFGETRRRDDPALLQPRRRAVVSLPALRRGGKAASLPA